jgi:diaminohydroxyphosphoribosylaminopyrimidine deaminase/5-amino-6-(5-phosphoribosylamino)uracil reductase
MGKARLRLVIFVVSFYATTLLASPSRLSFVSFTSPIRVSNTTTSEIDVDTSEQDGIYMRRAIELATRALGKTSPNPCVGCVIVKDGVVIGEGWHEKAGEPHAEVYALRSAGENAKGATAYVSLEPCNHYGRTPPCTLALLK